MRDLQIYIGNGQSEYQLHSLSSWIPSLTHRPIEGLENPTQRVDANDNPGFRGQTISQALSGGSIITIKGSIRAPMGLGNDEAIDAYLAEREKFIAAITTRYDSYGRAIPLTLRILHQDGVEYTAQVTKQRFSLPGALPYSGSWAFQLLNPSGLLKESAVHTATVTLARPGGVLLAVDTILPFLLGSSDGGQVTIPCASTVQTFPTIHIAGPVQHPVLVNTTVGERLALNLDLTASDYVEVDMERGLTLLGGVNDQFPKVSDDSRFWALAPGVDNTILFRANTYQTGSAIISWQTLKEGI